MLVTLGGQRVNIYPQWRKTTHRQDVYDRNCSYVICTVNLYRLSLLVTLTNYVQVYAHKEMMW